MGRETALGLAPQSAKERRTGEICAQHPPSEGGGLPPGREGYPATVAKSRPEHLGGDLGTGLTNAAFRGEGRCMGALPSERIS
jgi:hypothetical protein